MNKADFLEEIPIFSTMKKEDLERLASQAKEHSFLDGQAIIREGDCDARLFVIVSGEAEVVKSLGEKTEKRVRTLGPYSYFGEMALIDDLPRSACIVAKGGVKVIALEKLDLYKEIEKYPALAMELLQMLSRRIRAIEKCVMNTLGALLPVCVHCKRISEDGCTWTPLDKYIADHSETEVSHRICPECSKKLYPQFYVKE